MNPNLNEEELIMAMQPAVCHQCGGALKVDDVDLNGFCECPFCHVSSKVIDVITIDGLPSAKSLLMNAGFAVQNGDIDGAMNLFNQVIMIKPNCHEAWWGLYKAQCTVDNHYGYRDKYGNSGVKVKAMLIQQALQQYAYRAIQFAPKEVAQWYKNDILPSEQFVYAVNTGQITDKKPGLFGSLFKK